MLRIHKSMIVNNKDKVRIETPVTETFPDGSRKEHMIWCETSAEYADCLCTERCDALLIGLFPYAVINGHDIQSDIPATSELLYKLKEVALPMFTKMSARACKIKIDIAHTNEPLPNQGAVGTGISLGVDSMYTVMKHWNDSDSILKLTHLCFFNVGSHGRGEEGEDLYEYHVRRVSEFAKENLFKLVIINSNFADEFHQRYDYVHVYAAAFAVFTLQKLWSHYFYASAGCFHGEIDLRDWDKKDSGLMSLFLQGILSTPNLTFHADAEDVTRLQKLEALSNYEPAWKYLYVCVSGKDNCCRCRKCIRTILSLKVLGIREKFNTVFPPTKESRRRNFHFIMKGLRKGDFFVKEIVRAFFKQKKNG